MERMAIFKPWVQLPVSATCSGRQWNSSAAASRQAYTVSDASIAAGYPPRPGFAQVYIARSTARYTPGGLRKEVAPLSR